MSRRSRRAGVAAREARWRVISGQAYPTASQALPSTRMGSILPTHPLEVLEVVLCFPSARQAEQPVELDVSGDMLCQPVEHLLDKRVVGNGGGTGAEAREPGRALTVVGEQAMDVGTDDAAVG